MNLLWIIQLFNLIGGVIVGDLYYFSADSAKNETRDRVIKLAETQYKYVLGVIYDGIQKGINEGKNKLTAVFDYESLKEHLENFEFGNDNTESIYYIDMIIQKYLKYKRFNITERNIDLHKYEIHIEW